MTRNIFKELAEVRQWPGVSIYIPTQRSGDNKKGRIRFKNHIQDIRDRLHEQGMQGKKILDFLQPLDMLLEDASIWRHLSDGLAVFLSPGKFAYSTFPIRFKEFAEVDSQFYLLPLMPVFNGDGRFFIQALSLSQVRLFEGSRDHVSQIGIDDLVPQTLQDTVGHDYEPKSLQVRAGQTGTGESMYHGQGRGKDDKKEEIVKHLREVDRNLVPLLQGYDSPLVLACVDYIFALYKKVNSYSKLYPKNISGSPDEVNMEVLHQKAWELLKDHFFRHRQETLKHYHFLTSKGRTSSVLSDLLPAAAEGRIDTLFVLRDSHLWGVFDEKSGEVRLEDKKTPQNHCLLDISAKKAFLQGARVYLLDAEDMPEDSTPATATFRF